MFETLCRLSEWAKLQRLVWAVILVFALLGFGITTAAFLVDLLDGIAAPWVQDMVSLIRKHLQLDEDIADFLRSVSLTLIGVSIPYILIVCQQRKAVISALASGYWLNFLRHFVGGDFKVVLLPPGHLITLETDSAINQTKAIFCSRWEIELREEYIKEAGRNVLVVYYDGQRLPVVVDMCRNLAVLGQIIENELGRVFGGTFCTAETKFAYLSKKYFTHLKSKWISKMDLVNSIMVLEGIEDPRFEAIIKKNVGLA
ncbi:hypothetical protein AB2B41_22230 [Marimonas sp. MJW-29]|uniref:Uncharacterized protein n=1 Tax=Sulfitobacter sediminis TaxID=3234186 RepID=A0ABV3RTJ2_9RHOB